MKTQNKNKLDFSKNVILELSENEINSIGGGSHWICSVIASYILNQMDHINFSVVKH